MENKSEIMNPQIKKVTIGKKILKEINIYPLSAGDQIRLSNILSEAMQGAFAKANVSELEFIDFLREVIQNHLGTVLSFITDEGAELADDITNDQAIEIGTIVYETNFISLKKKLQAMVQKAKEKGLSLGRLSPASSESIPSTD